MTTSQVLSLVWSFWEAHWPSVLIIITVVMIIAWFFWPDESTYHRLEREVGELRAYIGGTYTTFPDDNSYWGEHLQTSLTHTGIQVKVVLRIPLFTKRAHQIHYLQYQQQGLMVN